MPKTGVAEEPEFDEDDIFRQAAAAVEAEDGLVRLPELVPIDDLIPAQINNVVYRPVALDDPSIVALSDAIDRTTLIDPLVITQDNVIVSGHRRRAAAKLSGYDKLPCVRLDIWSSDPRFPAFLVSFNAQRDKSPIERVREQMVLATPEDAEAALVRHRIEKAKVKTAKLVLGYRKPRKRITKAKYPMLNAIKKILDELEELWPVSDRKVHYEMLNLKPLRHASKPGSVYQNDKASYKDLTDLLTRARIEGHVKWEAIGDETRPVSNWDVHANVGEFVAREKDGFLKGYHRDLMIGQPNHVEIVIEKMTAEGMIRPVAWKYSIPYTVGRGYASLAPRKDMVDRYLASGKERLVILFGADHDPEGEDMPISYGQSIRDDFGIEKVDVVKVGVTMKQVRQLNLPALNKAKTEGSRYDKYQAKHGDHIYEIEAVKTEVIRQWFHDAIRSVIDVEMFNRQVDLLNQESRTLEAVRKTAVEMIAKLQM